MAFADEYLEVRVVSADSADVSDLDTGGHQHRLAVTTTERFHQAQALDEVRVNVADVHFGVYADGGEKLLRPERRASDVIEATAEIREVFYRQGEAAGELVTAIAQQQIAALLEGGGNVKALDTACGATIGVVFPAHDEGGPVETFDDLRRNDTDNADVPVIAGQHDDRLAVEINFLAHPRLRLAEDERLPALTLDIVTFQLQGQLHGSVRVVLQQQVNSVSGFGHATDGIEAGSQTEADVLRRQFTGQSGQAQQGSEAFLAGLRQKLQAPFDHNAVVARKLDDVGDGANRDQVEKRTLQRGNRHVEQRADRFGDFVCEADSGQIVGFTLEVVALVVNDDGVGQLRSRLVVVYDDDLGSKAVGLGDLGIVRNATIHGDDELDTLGDSLLNCVGTEAIAVIDAVRYVVVDISAELVEEAGQQGGGGDAVGVIVTVNEDGLIAPDGHDNALGGGAHVGKLEGVAQGVEVSAEEFADGLRCGDAPRTQNRRDEGVYAGGSGKLEFGCLVTWCQLPDYFLHRRHRTAHSTP